MVGSIKHIGLYNRPPPCNVFRFHEGYTVQPFCARVKPSQPHHPTDAALQSMTTKRTAVSNNLLILIHNTGANGRGCMLHSFAFRTFQKHSLYTNLLLYRLRSIRYVTLSSKTSPVCMISQLKNVKLKKDNVENNRQNHDFSSIINKLLSSEIYNAY